LCNQIKKGGEYMPSNPDIHTFAVKWFDVFRNTKAVIEDVETTAFSDECFALGFEMDCGKSFENAYPEVKAFADYRELDKIVDGITDIPLLGAAIFSKWRYFTHWGGPGEDILSFENRSWFITALGRLERLASDNEETALVCGERLGVRYI